MDLHESSRTYVCQYPCMDTHSAHAGALVHTHKHVPTHAYTHTQIETHIHTHTYHGTYTHLYTPTYTHTPFLSFYLSLVLSLVHSITPKHSREGFRWEGGIQMSMTLIWYTWVWNKPWCMDSCWSVVSLLGFHTLCHSVLLCFINPILVGLRLYEHSTPSRMTYVTPYTVTLSFFLSWVSKTQPNHCTKRMTNTRLAT